MTLTYERCHAFGGWVVLDGATILHHAMSEVDARSWVDGLTDEYGDDR